MLKKFSLKSCLVAAVLSVSSIATYAQAVAPTTAAYGKDYWHGDNFFTALNSNAAPSPRAARAKLSNAKATTILFGARMYDPTPLVSSIGPTIKYAAAAIANPNPGAPRSDNIIHIKNATAFFITVGDVYGTQYPTSGPFQFKGENVKAHPLANYPNLDKAESYSYSPTDVILYLHDGKLYQSTATPWANASGSASVVASGITDHRIWGGRYVYKNADGMYLTSGNSQYKIGNAGDAFDFLKESTIFSADRMILRKPDNKYVFFTNASLTNFTELLEISAVNSPLGGYILGKVNASNTILIGTSADAKDYAVPTQLLAQNFKKLLYFSNQPSRFWSWSYNPVSFVGPFLFAYIDQNDKLVVSSYTWNGDHSSVGLYSSSTEIEWSKYVSTTSWGVDTTVTTTTSPFTWNTSDSRIDGNSDAHYNRAGLLATNGVLSSRLYFRSPTATWTEESFSKAPGFNDYSFGSSVLINLSIGADGTLNKAASDGTSPVKMTAATKVMDGPAYTAFRNKQQTDAGYAGPVRAGEYIIDRLTEAVVEVSSLGVAVPTTNSSSVRLDMPGWPLMANAPSNPVSQFAQALALDPGAKPVYAGNANAGIMLGTDGNLKYVGEIGNYTTPVLSQKWAFSKPVSIPIEAIYPPQGVVATKGADNNSVSVSWASGALSTYTIKRGYGAYQATVATGLTASPYIDTNTTGGGSKASPMNYQVTASSNHEVYADNINTNLFTASPVLTYGGCDFYESNTTKPCLGWRALAPTGLTVPPLTVAANTVNNELPNITVVDPDGIDDTFTYNVVSQPTSGVAALNALKKIVYTPAPGFQGNDSFLISATDRAGNSINGPAPIVVTCPAPELTSVAVPAVFAGLTTQVASVRHTTNSCNGFVTVTMKIIDSATNAEITNLSQVRGAEPTGPARTTGFSLLNVPPGMYRIDATVRSEVPSLSATNFATKSATFTVNGFGQHNLVLNKELYTEDDLIIAEVKPTTGSCALVSLEAAKAEGKCYLVWTVNTLISSSAPNPATVQGYASTGVNYEFKAEIFKFDSFQVAQKINEVNGTYTVLPGLPTILKPIAFAKPVVRWMDKITFAFQRESGFDCKIALTSQEAMPLALAGQKVCLLETQLPNGLSWVANQTNPTVTGRIDQWNAESPNVTIPYKLSKFYVAKEPLLMINSNVTIPVVNFQLTTQLAQDRLSYAVNSSNAILEAKNVGRIPTDATNCTFSRSEADAAVAYATSTAPVCLVEWDAIPAGLAVDTTVPLLKLVGKPTVTGDLPVEFSVYVVKTNAENVLVKELVAKHTSTLKVVEMLPLGYTLLNPVVGTILLAGEETPRFLVGDDGRFGDILITGGDFSTIKMTIVEVGIAPQVFTGLKNGDKRTIALGAGTKGAWLSRNAELKLEYEEVSGGTVMNTTIAAMQLPAQKVLTSVFAPVVVPNDNEPFSIQSQVGLASSGKILQYDAVRDGNWMMSLMIKQGTSLVPVTDYAFPDAQGMATFSGLTYSTFVGTEVFSAASLVKPEGSVLSIPDRSITSASSIKPIFVMGGAIQAATTVARPTGAAPLKQTLDLKLSAEGSLALKSVIWYFSDDDTATWKPLGLTGRAATYTFNKGGIYYIKGQMTNKYTNLVSWSTPVAFTVVETLAVSIQTNTLFLPGTPVTLTLEVKSKEGTPMTEYDSRWEVMDSGGTPTNYTDVAQIALASEVPQTFDVNVMVKSKTMDGNNPASWTILNKRIVFFSPVKPRVILTGPRVVEVEKTGTFTAKILKPWDAKAITDLQIGSKWVLPNGTEVTTTNLDFTPNAEDGLVQKITHHAWVVGLEDSTLAITETTVAISSYIFPNFIIKAQIDTIYSPAYLRLSAIAATPFDQAQMRGKKFVFTWEIPAQFLGTASGTQLRGVADTPGTYNFKFTVSDDRGNTQNLEYSLVIEQSRPWDVSINYLPALKFNRHPMTYVVKPAILGGHPKDRIKTVGYYLDDVLVSQTATIPRTIIIPTPGDHTVKMMAETLMGSSWEATNTLTVLQNNLPTCTLLELWDKTGKVVKLTPSCTDVDGRVSKILWYQDDVKLNKSSSYLYVTVSAEVPTTTIKVEVFDDAGGMVTLQQTVNYQGQ